MRRLKGTAVSPGIAVGRALVVERDTAPVFRLSLDPEGVGPEVARLEAALEGSREQLRAVKDRLSREVGALSAAGLNAEEPETSRACKFVYNYLIHI